MAGQLHLRGQWLSVEFAALQMELGAFGAAVSEDDLLAILERDPTPRSVLADGSVVWGDPDVGFVGSVDGTFGVDGYGVYEGPIAELARAEGFEGSIALHGVDPAALYAAVRAGY